MTEIELKMTEHNGRRYGAGVCFVNIGNSSHFSVALYAEPKKMILHKTQAAKWLVEQGLPPEEAEKIVRLAVDD